MASQDDNNSALGSVFAVIGIIAALVKSSDMGLDGGPTFLFVLAMAITGYQVGRVTELLVFRVLFIIATIIMFLMNFAIRRFVWEVLTAIVSD